MGMMIGLDKAKPSAITRLKFLPRIGFVVNFAGQEFTYRQAPFLEAIYHIRKNGLTMANFLEVTFQQLEEIHLDPPAKLKNLSKKLSKAKRKTKRKS